MSAIVRDTIILMIVCSSVVFFIALKNYFGWFKRKYKTRKSKHWQKRYSMPKK